MRIAFFFTLLLSLFFFLNEKQPFENYQETVDGFTFDMVPIPGGIFNMGSTEAAASNPSDQSPVHEVQVDSFWFAKMEVPWELYGQFLNRNKSEANLSTKNSPIKIDVDGISAATIPYVDMSFGMGKEGFPATSMTQYAASTFCKWLSAKTGQFYRLPTEAEWEYACKKGLQKEFALDSIAWFKNNSLEGYHPIGLKKPNALGLHDMQGNVAEWTLDQYIPDYYNNSPNKNPWAVPDKLYPRVLRGGSWKNDREKCTCTTRRASSPRWKRIDPQLPKSRWWHTNAPFVGIRVLRPYKTPAPEEVEKFWLNPIDEY